VAREGFVEEKEFVDVGIVFEDLEADGASEDGDVGVGEGVAGVFDRGGGPEGVAEGGGGDNEESVGGFVFGNEGACELREAFDEDIFHGLVISRRERTGI
jgi:hypothetical protein